MEQSSKLALPDAFLDFLKANGLDPSIYTATDSTPRYIRYSNSKHLSLLTLNIILQSCLLRVANIGSFVKKFNFDTLPMELIN